MSFSMIEHKEFQKSAVTMTLSAALSSLAIHVLFQATGWGNTLQSFILPALLASMVYSLPLLRNTPPASRAMVLLGVVLFVGGASRMFFGDVLGLAAFAIVPVFALFFTKGPKSSRFVGSFLWAAAMVSIGMFVLSRFLSASALLEMPSWVHVSFAGASFGLVSSLGLLVGHLQYEGNPIRVAYGRLSQSSGELSDLNARALSLWEKSSSLLSKNPEARKSLEGSVLRFFGVSARLQATDSDVSLAENVAAQMKTLEEKREKTSDEATKREYDLALQSLAAQQEYANQISTTRERTIARLHSYLATMEKTRLAVLNQQAASVAEDSTSIQSVLRELEDAGKLFDAERDVLNALEKHSTSAVN